MEPSLISAFIYSPVFPVIAYSVVALVYFGCWLTAFAIIPEDNFFVSRDSAWRIFCCVFILLHVPAALFLVIAALIKFLLF